MFKKDNLVRLISEDKDTEVMCVLEDSDGTTGTTYCVIGDDLDDHYFDTGDLELVAEEVLEDKVLNLAKRIQQQCDIISNAASNIKEMTKN
jgi:hypothetical protein